MGFYPSLGNVFRPTCCLPTLRPSNEFTPGTTAVAIPLPQRGSTSLLAPGAEKPGEKTGNLHQNLVKGVSFSQKRRELAIHDLQNSPDLASALLRSGEMLKAQELNIVLRHFGNLNRVDDLCQLFEWMREHGKTNGASYSGYIKVVGRNFSSMKALEVYNTINDDSTRTNVSVCNSTLHSLIKDGNLSSSLKLFNQMKRAGLEPDTVTYSTLLAGCAKARGGFLKAMDLVREMKFRGLSMDAVLYGTMISVCASNDECEEAQKYFDEMKIEGYSPNSFHYSSLLNAYAYAGNYKKADELVQEMRSAGLDLSKVILTTLLKAYVRSGLFEKSRELLDELQALGYAEDEMPYCILMDGLAKSGKLTEAKTIFQEMKQKQVKNDGYSYSIMITALCRSRLIDEAKQLACEYETKYGKYDVVILNSMLCVYCRSGEMDNVMKTMKRMDELAIIPDLSTFRILIKYFCTEKLYILAYRTMLDMHSKGHQPEEGLCVSLINRLGRISAHSEAFSLYTILKYGKRTMNKAIHHKILRILLAGDLLKDAYVVVKDNAKVIPPHAIKKFAIAFMEKGNINLVNDVIKSVHSSGYKIDPVIFEIAISRYVKQPEKKDLLFHLLQWMPGQEYHVNLSTRNMLLENSEPLGRQSLLELLSRHYMVLKSKREEKTK